jgi:hypothetical protein
VKINASETSPALAQTAAPRHFAPMTLPVTLALLAAAVALAVFAGWRGARPSQPHLGVRMAPWRLIMVLAAAAVFLLVIHLAALLGLPQAPPR